MAMRICIYCKQDVTYERENRNLLKGGAVGFWTNPLTGQATCTEAPVDSNGQQLHSVGDVHTPPVHDPEQLEAFLNGTYVPPAPKEPCGNLYGMDEKGEFLNCGLDEGHDGACAPGTPVDTRPAEAQNSANPAGSNLVMMDVEQNGDEITIKAEMDGLSMSLMFDKSKVGPADVNAMLQMFPAEANKVVLAELLGVDPAILDAAAEAEKAAQKPEPPKILEDPADIEKFLRGED